MYSLITHCIPENGKEKNHFGILINIFEYAKEIWYLVKYASNELRVILI